MWGYRFINDMCQHWQDKSWKQLDEVTPYNFRHRFQRDVLSCVGEYHFKRYAGKCNWDSISAIHKQSKRKKLYWNLHPEYKDW